MRAKLRTAGSPPRPERAGRAVLLRACNASGLTQDELGALIGTDARGVRRLQRKGRVRADRLDLLVAIENLSPSLQRRESVGLTTGARSGHPSPARTPRADDHSAEPNPQDAIALLVGGGAKAGDMPTCAQREATCGRPGRVAHEANGTTAEAIGGERSQDRPGAPLLLGASATRNDPYIHQQATAADRASDQHTGNAAARTAALPVAGARRRAA